MLHNELVFWFSQPPKVERGAYNEISKQWSSKVYYISYGDWSVERKRLKWDDENYGKACFISLADKSDRQLFVEKFLDEHSEAINIIPGFTSAVSQIVLRNSKNVKRKICVVSERPVPFYTKTGVLFRALRFIVKRIKYYGIYLKYRNEVEAVLPLGELGVKEFRRVGWPQEKLFPFMYCPELKMYEPLLRQNDAPNVSFLYVGRFMYSTKGIDYIQKAIKRIDSDNWSLDMAGGYGKDKDKILEWIKKQDNVHFVGSWESDKVIENIRNYDCVIVPSKGEGWNMIVHEAIAASVGVIVTDLAVSDELISSSGAGQVVRAFSAKALSDGMIRVINNPSIINEWKSKAFQFQRRVTPEIVGKYFIQILEHVFDNGEKPMCPWH